MSRNIIGRTVLAVALTITLLGVGYTSSAAQSFEKLSADILETLQMFYPVQSTSMGIHAYDHRFTDYSAKSVNQMISKLTDYEKKLYKYKSASLSPYDRINYNLLKSNVDIALQDLKKIQWHKKSPHLYVDEAINGIYYLMISDHAPLAERLVSVMNRMGAVPELFATARKNIHKPTRLQIEISSDMLTDAMNFYKEVAAELSNKFPERADELARVSTKAREVMNDFLVFLSSVTPGPDTDIAIGKNNFDYKLTHQYFLGYDSDSLLELGETLFEQADRDYRAYSAQVENSRTSGVDSVYVPTNFNRQDILDYYSWEAEQVKLFLQVNDLITIPERLASLTVVETPPFMRSLIGMYAYQPAGPFDTVQHGYFYVRPVPEDLDRRQLEARYRYVHRRGFRNAVVHEAYPGHHLQTQLAALNPDPVRKWQYNFMMMEGWALYAEEMMYEKGLYGMDSSTSRLSILGGIRFRAARIVIDVNLHTARWSYDECVQWMMKAMDLTSDSDRQFVESEIRRYTLTPTNQMSYLIGKLEIKNLLEAARKRGGENFSLKKFHDALLTEGSIPPALIWEIMGLKKI